MREKFEGLKEWAWALIAAVEIKGYIKMDLTIMQRILLIWFLWVLSLCLIYFVEERIERYESEH